MLCGLLAGVPVWWSLEFFVGHGVSTGLYSWLELIYRVLSLLALLIVVPCLQHSWSLDMMKALTCIGCVFFLLDVYWIVIAISRDGALWVTVCFHHGRCSNLTLMSAWVTIMLVLFKSEKACFEQQKEMMQFHSLRDAHCSKLEDEQRIRQAIAGAEDEVETVIDILLTAGAYTDNLRRSWDTGLNIERAGMTDVTTGVSFSMLAWSITALDLLSDISIVHVAHSRYFGLLCLLYTVSVLLIPLSVWRLEKQGPDTAVFTLQTWGLWGMLCLQVPILLCYLQGYDEVEAIHLVDFFDQSVLATVDTQTWAESDGFPIHISRTVLVARLLCMILAWTIVWVGVDLWSRLRIWLTRRAWSRDSEGNFSSRLNSDNDDDDQDSNMSGGSGAMQGTLELQQSVIFDPQEFGDSLQCPTCLEDFSKENTIKKTICDELSCSHYFHESCLAQWCQPQCMAMADTGHPALCTPQPPPRGQCQAESLEAGNTQLEEGIQNQTEGGVPPALIGAERQAQPEENATNEALAVVPVPEEASRARFLAGGVAERCFNDWLSAAFEEVARSPEARLGEDEAKFCKMAKVLCLHGWRTNVEFMEKQLKSLRSKLPSWEFSVLQGPISGMLAADDDVEKECLAPYFQWWEPLDGLEGQMSAVRYVAEHIRHNGPFDAVLGFSEGAACATAFAAALEGAGRWPQKIFWMSLPAVHRLSGGHPLVGLEAAEEMKQELKDVPGPKLIIAVSGVTPENLSRGCCMARSKPVRPIALPSLHVIGDTDEDRRNSEELAQEWYNISFAASQSEQSDGRILRHPHGHRFPLDCRPLAEALRELLPKGAKELERAAVGGC
ncbi:unnamed protein product [Effrenium voratum]|uniref:RING-type domain-containing protein n=1 Tax=Effrenium voratum TaxID=2562239 RepID=A0AA36NBU4_9DINO|nr:unnamed protein product [Effrenium voratum]